MRGLLSFVLSIGIASGCFAEMQCLSKLDEVKQKWASWADASVEAEKNSFLQQFGIDKSCLEDPKLIDEVKAQGRLKARQLLDYYSKLDDSTAEEKACMQELVDKVFGDINCKVVHCSNLPLDVISIEQDLLQNCSYVFMNVKEGLKNLEQIEDTLYHERSHCLYKDVYCSGVILYAANLKKLGFDQLNQVALKICCFRKMCETRADVHAAINSPYRGQRFIKFLQPAPQNVESPVHPKTADRIALLEKIKKELDAAEEIDKSKKS